MCWSCDPLGVERPAEVISSDVDTEEIEVLDSFHSSSIDVKRDLYSALGLPVVDYHFLNFLDIKREIIVMAPFWHTSDLLSVGCLISVCDEAQDGCLTSNLENDAGTVIDNTVMSEQTVELGAEYTSLWGACV